MRLHIEELTHLGDPRELIFASVQLSPHDMELITATKTFEWKTSGRLKRIGVIKELLKDLLDPKFYKKPDIIVFPEYSIPKAAFTSIDFSEIANTWSVIIVCGSYFEDDQNCELYRCNVCKIFLPHRSDPILIVKHHASPQEIDILKTHSKCANIARFIWKPEGVPPASISIFLCRDYLSPFAKTASSADPDTLTEQQIARVSLKDWDREGINVVVMHNVDSTVFEGTAALDVRRLYGKRKLVLFTNAATGGPRLSTALLGASNDIDRDADVAAKMSNTDEGVLIFQARIWNVAGSKEVPDSINSFPVSHKQIFSFRNGGLAPVTVEERTVLRRAIFHPAFFAAMQQNLVVEFFVVKSVLDVEAAIKANNLRHISAGYVRGIEDIMIRRYVERSTCPGNTIPELSLPFYYARDTASEHLIDVSDSYLRVLIEPHDIIKLRGAVIPAANESPWETRQVKIIDIIDDPKGVNEIISVARDMLPDQKIPSHLAAAFLDEPENFRPAGGQEKENDLRDMYVFIRVKEEKNREILTAYVNSDLLPNMNVREVCRISRMLTPASSRLVEFQYMIRIKSPSFEADKLIMDLLYWSSRNNVRIGVRTNEIWRYIMTNSVEGMKHTRMGPIQLELLTRIAAEDALAGNSVSHGLMEEVANAIENHTKLLNIRGARSCVGHLKDFYTHVCVYSCLQDEAKKFSHLKKSQAAWADLYKSFERTASLLLTSALGLPEGTSSAVIVAEISHITPSAFEKMPEGEKSDTVKIFLKFYNRLVSGTDPMIKRVRGDYEKTRNQRNMIQHGGHEISWGEFISIIDEIDSDQFQSLVEVTGAMCANINAVYLEAKRRELSTR